MARIHARKRGKAGSKRPMRKGYPRWVKYKKNEVEKLIVKYAKEDKSSSEIGMILRDQYGIPKTKIYNIKVSEVLKEKGKFSEPTLINLQKKTDKIKEHHNKNKGDQKAKRALIITSAKLKKVREYLKVKS